jgi:predicted Zn-dependent peptidase
MKRFLLILFLAAFSLLVAAPVQAQTGELKLPPYKKLKLNSGMTVLLMERHQVPLLSLQVIVKAGSVADPAGSEGVASLTAELLRKGTKTRSADQFSAELDFIGGQFGTSATSDYTGITAEFVKKDISKGLDLLANALLNPTFPQDEVTKLRKQRIDGIKAAKDEALGVLRIYCNSYLYGSHPYARPTEGDEKSLAGITHDAVEKFYQSYYTPASTILAVVGDFSSAEMEKLVAEKFGTWPARPAPAMNLPEPAVVQGKKLLLIDKPDSTQTFYCIGNLGIARTNPDRVYLRVVNTLFGGRFTSMLNTELRINSGLTYGARSFFDQRKVRGPFLISSYTRNATTEKAVDMTLDILKRLHEKGITEDELKSAKNYLKGQFPPTIETSDQLASLLAQLEFYGLDEQEINNFYAQLDAMTLADAKRVIQQYFPLDNLVFVLIGKASEIGGMVRKYAPRMDTRSITEPGFWSEPSAASVSAR